MVVFKKRLRNRKLRGNVVTHYIYRLHGSVPYVHLKKLSLELASNFEKLVSEYGPVLRRTTEKEAAFQLAVQELYTAYEAAFEELLHQAIDSPMFLQHPLVKKIIINSWKALEERGEVKLHAISVMSNHVHVILSHPLPNGAVLIGELFERHKRYTATRINRLQNCKGRKVWAKPVFDRDIRHGKYWTVIDYVLNNPVQAGLTIDRYNWVGNYIRPELLAQ